MAEGGGARRGDAAAGRGENSIVIVGGANMLGWPERTGEEDTEVFMGAGAVLLQREIPDSVNIQAAEAAKISGVLVILYVGGVETPIPKELLCLVHILSPNEMELACLTGMPTETFEYISKAVRKCHEMGVKQLLVKLGEEGSALFVEGEEPIRRPIIPAAKVLGTTGAGDTLTAAYAVSHVEGKTRKEALKFAAAAASIRSMPKIDAVIELLESL
ncbi:ribokinase isoform X1 [Iris pallida]|uniref:Ribokinase isoform X1 n=1 Tax=Iris pallida TaxID=29817 RepID=A0AAX6G106_IRIPA|nr:ribokinase isoform X1 [Iris pallida]